MSAAAAAEPANVSIPIHDHHHATSSAAVPPAAAAAPAAAVAARKVGIPFFRRGDHHRGSRCLAFLDFLLRIAAFGPALAAAISTGTSDETLSVFTEYYQFRARFDDFPAFLFFMVANAIVAGYLVLSLPFSAIMAVLLTAGAAAATAIVDLAHNGNLRANWVAICMQFHGFCQRTSGSVVASFLSVLILVFLVILAACSIRKRH
uniref:CASP-like protein n=1 Tax=Leersia perrieri TaxID=77586 RepID=A0A0D9WBD4_9ORYZ